MTNDPIVFVVDDDERARESVCALVQSMGLDSVPFASAEEFLEQHTNDHAGCLITDVRMLGISGLELHEKLNEMGSNLPVIVITAHATTAVTVQAMQGGAITLLDKPYREDELWSAIRKALALDAKNRVRNSHRQEIRQRRDQLSTSERDVLELVVSGKANKVIASRLDISTRTVENRRREIYRKMKADSVVDLVKMVIEADAGNLERELL